MGDLVRRLGREKNTELEKNFDEIVDKYRKMADTSGYHGELRFKKEGGYTVIFVELDDEK
jgi:hypothetical protein